MSGAGTQKVFEDDRIVVWHFDLEPGETGERHTHQLDYMARVLSGATLEVFGPEGELLYRVTRRSGESMSFRVEDNLVIAEGSDRPGVPATHSVRNAGDTPFREVLVEFKT